MLINKSPSVGGKSVFVCSLSLGICNITRAYSVDVHMGVHTVWMYIWVYIQCGCTYGCTCSVDVHMGIHTVWVYVWVYIVWMYIWVYIQYGCMYGYIYSVYAADRCFTTTCSCVVCVTSPRSLAAVAPTFWERSTRASSFPRGSNARACLRVSFCW